MTKSIKKISRRDAMKVAAAAVGAAALANLPSKWSKPELAAGVLPAHAQTSTGVIICDDDLGPFAVALPYDTSGYFGANLFNMSAGLLVNYQISSIGGIAITSGAATGMLTTDLNGDVTTPLISALVTGAPCSLVCEFIFDGQTCAQTVSFEESTTTPKKNPSGIWNDL